MAIALATSKLSVIRLRLAPLTSNAETLSSFDGIIQEEYVMSLKPFSKKYSASDRVATVIPPALPLTASRATFASVQKRPTAAACCLAVCN